MNYSGMRFVSIAENELQGHCAFFTVYKCQILIWKILVFPIAKILFQTSRGRKQAKDLN